jgi:hypothetical protein
MTTPRTDVEEFLLGTIQKIRDIQRQPGVGGLALGLREHDWQLWRLGQEWLERHETRTLGVPLAARGGYGPDVFLATQLYQNGGHTALIGDFVSALTPTAEGEPPPQVILTNAFHENGETLPETIRVRTGVAAENAHILRGPTLEARLDQLFTLLLALRPRRLFLFHHPDDPLACVVAQPEIAGQCFLVHHADATPAFGLYLPGVQIIELNPAASAMARAHQLPSELLLLTAPDPGPRPCDFLTQEHLVTATCGGAHKYAGDYVFSYPETVAVILSATGGWHIHIGPLAAETSAVISSALHRAGVAPDRFIHRPWVPSLREALWEHKCDVYVSSFPIDGARAYVEVAASGTPYLGHGRLRSRSDLALTPTNAAVWHTWSDLTAALGSLNDPGVLEAKSTQIRKSYEDRHHPAVFRRTLGSIVAGEGGIRDPDEGGRDLLMTRTLLGTLETAFIAGNDRLDRRLDGILVETHEEARRSEERQRHLAEELGRLAEELRQSQLRADAARRTFEAHLSSLKDSLLKWDAIDRRLEQTVVDGDEARRRREELFKAKAAQWRAVRMRTRKKLRQLRKEVRRLNAEQRRRSHRGIFRWLRH